MESMRRIRPFEMGADRAHLPSEWQKWKRELERYFDAVGTSSQWEKRSLMLHLAGSEVQEIFDHLPGVNNVPLVLTDPPYYDIAIRKLDEHFEPMRRRSYERHVFRQISQKPNERFADFVLRLRIQARRCEFDRYDPRETDDRIIEQIVEACKSTELRRQVLAKDLTLEEIVTLGTTLADVQAQVKEIDRHHIESPSLDVSKITKYPARSNKEYRVQTTPRATDRACYACGRRGHLKGDNFCRAKNAKCMQCGEVGHFLNRCLKRANFGGAGPAKPKRIRLIESNNEQEDDHVFFAMGKNMFEFVVGEIKIPMIIDSGADANIIDKTTWEQARRAGMVMKSCTPDADRKLVAYATKKPMNISCMFTAEIQAGCNKVDAKFYVVDKGQRSLLGDFTAKQLKVLKVGFDVCSLESPEEKCFPKIKGIMVEIPIDTSIQPVQQAYRRAPIALEERIFDKLQYLLQKDIIEKVHGPSPWVSPVVPIVKKSGDIRICVDMRKANQAVLRESHPLPLIEELLGNVVGAVKFSKLDIKEAYHQLEISEKSRIITTFITKYGLFRYKRLMFGVSCAPELFQKVMDTITAGLEGVIVYLDDVMIWGRSQREHDTRVNDLINRLKEYNVRLNLEKCQFNVDHLEFLGHDLSTAGIKPTESRVVAVKQFREPANIAELRSFLGLVTYVGRFIPHLATKTDSLRTLLRGDMKFDWTSVQRSAFNDIKQAVSKIDYLGFFNPRDSTILVADASPSGLGAVLLQENLRGERRIISYASKSLTDLERKYFQTEREALALVWAVDRFRLYLQGIRFKLVTDCKPLQFLFSPRSKPCARIERWVLRLQSYSYDVVYEAGVTNLVDALSRLSPTVAKPFDLESDSYINMVMTAPHSCAISIQEIQFETNKDQDITELINALNGSEWTVKAKIFKPYESELCTSGGVLLRGERIVLPTSLQERTLKIAHEGHPGIVVMKRRLRQKVWWPGMDKAVENFVKRCKECTLVSATTVPEPLIRTKMPDQPWAHVAADFMGPLPSGHNLLVLVDYFSRFVEVIVMKEITAKLTIQALHETFCRYGIPESLKTDNGPQFVSEALRQFSKEYGIELRRTTPYWPQANGEVERANRALKKRLQISQEFSESDWKWDLRMYLLMYNSTPHSTTGVAPSALMFGRVLRDKLPSISTLSRPSVEEVRDVDLEKKMKEAEYADNRRRAKPNVLKEGDVVIAKRMARDNKLSTNFSPEEMTVLKRSGPDVTLKSNANGKIMHRNVSHLKPITLSDADYEKCNDQTDEDQTLNLEPPQDAQPEPSRRTQREFKKPEYLRDYHLSAVQEQ